MFNEFAKNIFPKPVLFSEEKEEEEEEEKKKT